MKTPSIVVALAVALLAVGCAATLPVGVTGSAAPAASATPAGSPAPTATPGTRAGKANAG